MHRSFASVALLIGLPSCDPDAVEEPSPTAIDRPVGKGDGAREAPSAAIAFDADFTTPVAVPGLVAGGQVRIDYDAQRFWDVYDGAGSLGYFASSFHCYGYGCCEASFPEISAHHRFDGGPATTTDVSDGPATLAIPAGTDQLELWFSAPGFELRTWYCGCDAACAEANYAAAQPQWHAREAWDSRWGQNYAFDVASGAFEVVHGEAVKLIDARTDGDVFAGTIELENLAYDKRVRVHYTMLDAQGHPGPWQDLDAGFLGMAEGEDFERWAFAASDPAFATATVRFAIRYDVAGNPRWDNNCGWNYQLAPGELASGRGC